MVHTYDAVTDSVTLSVLRMGCTTFTAGAGETLRTDVLRPPGDIALKYIKWKSPNQLIEMTAAEKTVVDATLLAAEALSSAGAVKIDQAYATVAALPATPSADYLLVALDATGAGPPGLAMSKGGSWYIFESV